MRKSKYSAKQRKMAALAPPRDKITAADLKELRDKKKEEKVTDDCWELTVTADAVRLLHRSVSFYYENGPAGPDPEEQENLRNLSRSCQQ